MMPFYDYTSFNEVCKALLVAFLFFLVIVWVGNNIDDWLKNWYFRKLTKKNWQRLLAEYRVGRIDDGGQEPSSQNRRHDATGINDTVQMWPVSELEEKKD